MLEDGIHTLAIGHKDVTANVDEDRIGNPRADEVFPEKIARDMGLFWSRRKGATQRAGVSLTQIHEENDDEAIEAGQAARNHLREMVNQVPDFLDRYNPEAARPPTRHREECGSNNSATRPKRQRIEMATDSEEETSQCSQAQPIQQDSRTQFHSGVARVDSVGSEEETVLTSAAAKAARDSLQNSLVNDEACEESACRIESESLNTSSNDYSDHHHSDADDGTSNDSDLDFLVGDDCFE